MLHIIFVYFASNVQYSDFLVKESKIFVHDCKHEKYAIFQGSTTTRGMVSIEKSNRSVLDEKTNKLPIKRLNNYTSGIFF